jgi:hypothetical protein
VALDMLDRLCLDPGTRTIGELMQEREWAAWEIRRLRRDVDRLSRKKEAARIETQISQEADDRPTENLACQQRIHIFLHSALKFIRPGCAGLLV